ncbi:MULTISPECIES: MFS transporter [Halomonadaceae]|jgi:predicted MFS family arabinose efflux permease|uniref:MFS transporter n=1 Tax=Halomonadaceae TaxID=28256 RepID=UPI0012EFF053|nr:MULTISPECIES: MFS transporter [Halomonas]CAD5271010.1 Transporter [Halomonas sp. 156]CAD5279562.1 Transporter [Halomonas sp. 113]CAD5280980.1 Transporter [Halomonas sp. 59]CAD5287138.1 Transporter [Halomonas sp. I3]VXB08190.1 Transporter [Halomonas titanicae]
MNNTTCSASPSLLTATPTAEPTSANWMGIVSLALGVFGLVTAEFLPASLLTAMAADLNISVGAAGQAVTATAAVAALAALTIPLLTRNFDRRFVLLGLSLLLVVSNVLAATANSFFVLIIARVLLGIALGGFWSMAAALAMRMVPDNLFARAMSIVLTGVSVATVCAAPLGAYIGGLWGWRSAFIAASCLSLVTLVTQLFVIPAMPPKDNPSLRILVQLLTRTQVRVVLLAVVLMISGHFAGFTYIRPLLEEVAQLSVSAISAVLLGFGIGGFFGNFAGAFIAERSERNAIIFGGALIIAITITLLFAGSSASVTAVSIALWGFAFGAFPIGFQTWIVRAAPDQVEAAGGLIVAAFQVAIASGAIGGGILVDYLGALGGPLLALITTSLGTLLVLSFGPRSQSPA